MINHQPKIALPTSFLSNNPAMDPLILVVPPFTARETEAGTWQELRATNVVDLSVPRAGCTRSSQDWFGHAWSCLAAEGRTRSPLHLLPSSALCGLKIYPVTLETRPSQWWHTNFSWSSCLCFTYALVPTVFTPQYMLQSDSWFLLLSKILLG